MTPAEPDGPEPARADPVAATRVALTRLADRLAVVGPRWTGRASGESPAAAATAEEVWQRLERLAAIGAAWEGQPSHELGSDGALGEGPDGRLPAHALADVLTVLGHDLLAAADPHDPAHAAVLDELTAALDDLRRRC